MKGRYSKKPCPGNDVFIRAFEGLLSPEEKERLVDHVLECPTCGAKFDALRRLSKELRDREADVPDEALSRDEARQLRRLAKQRVRELTPGQKTKVRSLCTIPHMAAAGVLLAVIAGLVFLLVSRFASKPEEIYREVEDKKLTLIAPPERISETPSIFTWSALPQANTYHFRLIDEDLNTAYSVNTLKTSITLPQDVQKKLVRGKTYVWKVEATDDRHNIIGSGAQSFTIQ